MSEQSSVNTVVPTLQSLLQALPGLSGVTVSEGPATPAEMERKDLIQILDAKGDQEPHALNRTTQPRQEEVDLNLLISVKGETRNKQATLRARAYALLNEIGAALRSDPHMGLSNVYGAYIARVDYMPRANDHARESAIDFDIHYTARFS
jgi:hypothetical protein